MNQTLYKTEHMNSLIRHIENNLNAELDTGLLSVAGHLSHNQLYRDFYSLTGHSVKEYIRKRRLSNALALIKASDLPLADIAYQYSFSSQQALCRAVKQTLNMTPLEYRDSDIYYFFPPFNGSFIQSVTVARETIPQTFCLCFYHSSLKNIEERAIYAFLKTFPDYNGRILGRNGRQDSRQFCYELYLTDLGLDYDRLLTPGYSSFKVAGLREVNEAMFAVSTVPNDEQRINSAWDYLYSGWLHSSMFEYTGEPYYEEYILRNGKASRLKLYLPIRRREAETRISLVSDPDFSFVVSKAKGFNAERIAAKSVVDFMANRYPYIIKTASLYYLSKGKNTYTCGVRINHELTITGTDANNSAIEKITTSRGNYLMLESSVAGDYDRYTDMLIAFADNNGMTVDNTLQNEIFAVYDVSDSFDNPKIRMYCKVNMNF